MMQDTKIFECSMNYEFDVEGLKKAQEITFVTDGGPYLGEVVNSCKL